jgi:hypothetical protein
VVDDEVIRAAANVARLEPADIDGTVPVDGRVLLADVGGELG